MTTMRFWCGRCSAEIIGGVPSCPNCGQEFKWEAGWDRPPLIEVKEMSIEAAREIEAFLEHLTGDTPLSITPAEFAARHAHEFLCFGYHIHNWADERFHRWIKELGAILFDRERLERCRLQYLTPEELAYVRQREKDEF